MRTVRNGTDRAHLIERLNTLSGNETPRWGKMNVAQMLSHLVQAGELPFEVSLPDKSTFVSRTFIKPLILYILPMPKEVRVTAALDQLVGGRPPVEFDSDRREVIALMERLGALPDGSDCKHHPMFGRLSSAEWSRIAYKHIDHHLRQFGV